MSYQEIDGKIVLTMDKSDYFRLLTGLGIATGALAPKHCIKECNLILEGGAGLGGRGCEHDSSLVVGV